MWVSLPSPGKGNDSCHYLGRQEGMLERQVLALGFLDCVRVFVCSVCRKTPPRAGHSPPPLCSPRPALGGFGATYGSPALPFHWPSEPFISPLPTQAGTRGARKSLSSLPGNHQGLCSQPLCAAVYLSHMDHIVDSKPAPHASALELDSH